MLAKANAVSMPSRRLAAAHRIAQAHKLLMFPIDHHIYAGALADAQTAVRGALDEEAFSQLWAEGEQLSQEAAVVLALGKLFKFVPTRLALAEALSGHKLPLLA